MRSQRPLPPPPWWWLHQGAALLDQAAQVASKLSQVSCAHSGPPSVGSAGLPHVLLRRIVTAVLHVLYEEAGQQGKRGETCRKTVTEVGGR